MMHRLECDASETCGCDCPCHARCRHLMTYAKMPCWRRPGHSGEHRTQESVEYDRQRPRRRLSAWRRVVCDHPLAARATDGRRTWCWACRVAA
jgi:hypothetical protein